MSNPYKDYDVIITSPDGEEVITLPLLGYKETDIKKMTRRAYKSAIDFFQSSENISGDPRIVLIALSCELFLKAILMKVLDKKVKGHDLYELFYTELPIEQRSFIISSFSSSWAENEIENMIILHANSFITMRYTFEIGTYVYNISFLNEFAKCLKKAYENF